MQDEQNVPRWPLGAFVQKKANSSWRGVVVGFYATETTPQGYSVASLHEPGSVQVWPEAALTDWDGVTDAERAAAEERASIVAWLRAEPGLFDHVECHDLAYAIEAGQHIKP